MHPLDGVVSKIDRARAHLLDLQSHVDRLIADCIEAMIPYPEPDCCEYSFRFDVVPRPKLLLSNIFGDAVHNLRSALDYLAHQTVFHHGTKSQVPTTDTEFQVLTVPPAANRWGEPGLPNFSPKVSRDARLVYDSIQPYKLTGPWSTYSNHPLSILHNLDITDKHRQLLIAAVGVKGAAWFGGDAATILSFNSGPYNDGDEICRFHITDPAVAADFKPQLTFLVRLDEPDAGAFGRDQSVTRVGALLVYITERVVHAFQPLFPALTDAGSMREPERENPNG